MNQRGAVKAAWIVSVLGMVFALLALPSFGGFVGATDEGADCDSEAIPISEIALLNPNVHPSSGEVTIDLPRPIIAGTYSVTLVSFDDHSTNMPQQTEEQWFAQLLDADGRVVYESDPTRDLPDGHNFLTDTFDRQTVTGTATRLRAVHRGEGTGAAQRATLFSERNARRASASIRTRAKCRRSNLHAASSSNRVRDVRPLDRRVPGEVPRGGRDHADDPEQPRPRGSTVSA